ncbi:hypothetical protein [Pseudomonas sp.]|uniref:hypothetical protein n=1 Tax=Pseudomonas sp. TaxID=306 RepID=UPI0028B21DB6|nr:hypothetical protein [Pseudomonas sp.]
MPLFDRLFRRPAPRHYALLDERQHCCMLLTAAERPSGAHWVEVIENRLAWLGKPLPPSAWQPDICTAHEKAASCDSDTALRLPKRFDQSARPRRLSTIAVTSR